MDDRRRGERVTTKDKIAVWFKHHAPTAETQEKYIAIREAAEAFALVIEKHTPPCADQTAALRKLREVVMTANASIACGGV